MNTCRQTQVSKIASSRAAVITTLLSLASLAVAAQQPFVISIRTLHDSFKAGAEITVGVTLTNTSNEDVYFTGTCAPKADVNGFKVEVQDAQGKRAHETDILRWLRGEPVPEPKEITSGTSGPACGVVPQRGFVDDSFVLNRFYDLTKPGKYEIHVERTDKTSKVTVKSNTITVTITP